MRLVSYDGINFATYGVNKAFIIRGMPGVNRFVDMLPRRGGDPIGVGATNAGRPIPCVLAIEPTSLVTDDRVIEHRLRRILGLMNVDSEEARELICEIDVDTDNDGDIDAQVQVSVQAICGPWKWYDGGMRAIEITFEAVSSGWKTVTPVADGPDTINVGSPTTVWPNTSHRAVAPVITRSTHASFTTTDRFPVTVTNGSDFPLERETVVARMGTLTSTGNAQDFTVLKDGNYLSGLTFSDAGGYVPFVQFPGGAPANSTDLYYVLEADKGVTEPTYTTFDGNYSALDLEYVYVTATSGGASTFVVSGATWTTNRYAYASLVIVAGTGAGQARRILSNTGTTLTTFRNWTTNPGAGSIGVIVTSGIHYMGGRASSASSSSIVDSSVSWENLPFVVGGTVTTMAGTGSGQTRTIASVGTNTLNVSPNWGVTPDSTTVYIVERLGYHRYYTEQVNHAATHRGGWQQSARYSQPGKVAWGNDVLNGWAPFLMLDNADDFNQLRSSPVDVGGSLTHYFPILNATRRRGQDRRLQEEGQYDGVSIYHPCGYTYYATPLRYTNQNSAPGATEGIGRISLMARSPGGDEYQNTTGSFKTLAAVETTTPSSGAFGFDEPPTHFYLGVLPNDGIEISREAAESDIANVAWDEYVYLFTDGTKYGVSVGTADACIEINDEIRIGDYALQIGMMDGQRLWMKSTGQSLVLDCENARATITEVGQDDIDVTYAVTPVVYSGTETRVAERWPVLEPGNNTVTCSGSPWAAAGQFALSVAFRGVYLG